MPSLYTLLTRQLKDAGWVFHREGKGSHEIWTGPEGRKLTVPASIRKTTTANAILKQAGLPKEF